MKRRSFGAWGAAIISSATHGSRQRRGARSIWAALFAVLGCLVIAGTLYSAYELAWPFAISYGSWAAGIMLYGGLTSMGLLVGIGFLLTAHGVRASARPSQLKLWGKLLIVFGLMLSLGFPLMAYGTLLLRALVGLEPIGTYEYPNIFDTSLLALAVETMVVPILLGVVVIGAAITWGRRKRPSDVLDVFN